MLSRASVSGWGKPMSHLKFGGADTVALAERYGTPLYLLDEERIRRHYRDYRRAFPRADLYYAAKANGSLAVLRILARMGAGADVFSDGELALALRASIPPGKMLFNGVSKSPRELDAAVRHRVAVSMDSLDELEALGEAATRRGRVHPAAFRVNPDVSPRTHPKIATGLRTSKFGIPHREVEAAYRQMARTPGVRTAGIHCHIGSQILDLRPFTEATRKVMELAGAVSRFAPLDWVDLGGGLGVSYRFGDEAPAPRDLAEAILSPFESACDRLHIRPRLILEPGRSLVADAGLLLTRVHMVKRTHKTFIGVDAGFNLLIRPAMYGAYHEVAVANQWGRPPAGRYTVVGPICETGDVLAEDRELPEVRRGDLIALFTTGAYGYSMSSQYNARPRCPEVLLHRGKAEVIRRGEGFQDMVRGQVIPKRLR
ncbi:MAG: diaminopimelate decarboxylase [Euryarchaeota archaeon]|nr:diaminopimelate decarboxylase [Euryarchaeota archaeon]